MADYVLIESGDPDDAENVDAMFGHPDLVDYVHPDETFEFVNLDATAGTFDVTDGKAYHSVATLATSGGEDRHQLMVTAYSEGATDLELATVDGINYVWFDPQIGIGDSPTFEVTVAENAPSDEALLIGRLNATDDDGDSVAESLEVEGYNNRGQRHRNLHLEGRTADPDVDDDQGLVWLREDENLIKALPDGETTVAIGWSV